MHFFVEHPEGKGHCGDLVVDDMVKVKVKGPVTGPVWPRGFQDV